MSLRHHTFVSFELRFNVLFIIIIVICINCVGELLDLTYCGLTDQKRMLGRCRQSSVNGNYNDKHDLEAML